MLFCRYVVLSICCLFYFPSKDALDGFAYHSVHPSPGNLKVTSTISPYRTCFTAIFLKV